MKTAGGQPILREFPLLRGTFRGILLVGRDAIVSP